MTSERFSRASPIRLTLLTACVYATTMVGMHPHAYAQGGANAPRHKGGASASSPSDGKAAKPSAEAAASDKTRGDTAGGEFGSQAYRDFIEQALAEFKLENWPEARVLFRRAHELNPNARTLRSIGIVSFEMREYVPAISSLKEALQDTRQPLTPAQRKECEALLARANTFVGSYVLTLSPPQLKLTIDGSAAVLDEQGRLLVAFGEHALQASAPEYETATKTLSVQGGETEPLEISLRRAALQALASEDANEEGAIPAAIVVGGATTPVPVKRVRTGGLRYTWVAAGASAAFGAAAISTWIVGQNKFQSLKDECAASATGCVKGETDVSVPQRFSRTTNVLLGLSAASLVTAVVLLPIEWPRERRIALGVGPGNLTVRGSF